MTEVSGLHDITSKWQLRTQVSNLRTHTLTQMDTDKHAQDTRVGGEGVMGMATRVLTPRGWPWGCLMVVVLADMLTLWVGPLKWARLPTFTLLRPPPPNTCTCTDIRVVIDWFVVSYNYIH